LTLTGLGIGAFLVFYILRQWIKGTKFTEKVNGRGKVAIVTGANSGIGKELVRELSLRYVKVYMLCRSVTKGKSAAQDLFSRYGCDITKMIVKYGDLADLASLRRFAVEFNSEEEKLDILINNAGIMLHPKFERTVDGHELTWQSNYLGHFLLTELLIPKLEKSQDGGRIINVSSSVHLTADKIDPDACDSPKEFSRWMKPYKRSKLANVMHAVALTKRIRTRDSTSKVTANSCHPGIVDTNLVRLPIFQNCVKNVFAPIIWFVLKNANDGAQTPLFLALSKKVSGISGKYFSECKEMPVHPLAEDENACGILYNSSLETCGLI